MSRERFNSFWYRLTRMPPPPELMETFEKAYAEPHRAYHNLQHVLDCLAWLDQVRGLLQRPDEVEAALWFHDAVYDARATDNEERSGAWAVAELTKAGVSEEVRERVRTLILLTKTHRATTGDGAFLIDIDLSILGAPPRLFDEYDEAIRREYSWVSAEDYRAGRRRVLDGFLQRPRIYGTVYFQARLETLARDNLTRAVTRLST